MKKIVFLFLLFTSSLSFAGSGSIIPPAAGGGGGGVSSVATGSGLTGGTITSTGTLSLKYSDSLSSNTLTTGQCVMDSADAQGGLLCEGATANGFELFLTAVEPTADNTISFPDASGTVALTTSNVSTATALAANGSNCSAGQYPLGVSASGASESCTAAFAGPGSSTDNAIVRFDGTGGVTVQNSSVTIDDSGNVSLASLATVDGRDISVDGTKLDHLPDGAIGQIAIDGTPVTQQPTVNFVTTRSLTYTNSNNTGTTSSDFSPAFNFTNTLAGNPAFTAGQAGFDSGDSGGGVIFEGLTANSFEGILTTADVSADRTWTLPDVTGTVVTTGDTGSVTSTMINDGTVASGDLASSLSTAITSIQNFISSSQHATITTSNATATNIGSAVTIPTGSSTILEIKIVGRLTTHDGSIVSYGRYFVYENTSGTVTIRHNQNVPGTDFEAATPTNLSAANFPAPVISGATVQIQVQGLAGTNMTWDMWLTARNNS